MAPGSDRGSWEAEGNDKLPLTLVTGAGGYIGAALLEELAKQQVPVVGLSRRARARPGMLRCDFTSDNDLHELDGLQIDRVCHLGAVTGGCSEEDGLVVNVLGTQRLMRYLVDRGCRKFVLASSIAAVGLAASDFVPEAVPIPDAHPCLARDAVRPIQVLDGGDVASLQSGAT